MEQQRENALAEKRTAIQETLDAAREAAEEDQIERALELAQKASSDARALLDDHLREATLEDGHRLSGAA